LSADHRAVDGVLGSKFVNRIKYGLENPQTLIG
jgi:pyruvate/2-oxoglutarate dehydrogenase complex dihydrolipoamide acyltransferase (E2) component